MCFQKKSWYLLELNFDMRGIYPSVASIQCPGNCGLWWLHWLNLIQLPAWVARSEGCFEMNIDGSFMDNSWHLWTKFQPTSVLCIGGRIWGNFITSTLVLDLSALFSVLKVNICDSSSLRNYIYKTSHQFFIVTWSQVLYPICSHAWQKWFLLLEHPQQKM